jgi:type I restriction enzyme S subunit
MSWQSVAIADFCTTGSGGTPSRSKPDYYDGNIPWVKSGELREGVVTETSEHISEAAVEETAAKVVPAGAVLIAMYGATVGRVAMLGVPAATNQAVCHIVPDDSVAHARYVFWALQSKVPELLMRRLGGAQPNISQRIVRDTRLPLPPLAEQRRIAAILDKADAIRRKRREAVGLLDEFLRSAFLEMFGDPVRNEKGWEVVELGNLLTFVTSGSRGWAKYYSSSGARFIRSLDVQMNRITDTDSVFVNPPEGAEAERTRVLAGDVLLTITGSRIGRVAPVEELDGDAYISQHVAILRLAHTICPRYLSMFMSQERGGQHEIRQAQYGQTKPGLNLNDIRAFRVPLPPLEKQRVFSRVIDTVGILRNKHIDATEQSHTLFNSLSQRAFRGEM